MRRILTWILLRLSHVTAAHRIRSSIDRRSSRENNDTVPSEKNLCTIWGLWETHEGIEGKVGEYIWLLNE